MLAKSLVVLLALVSYANCDSRIIYRFYREATYIEDFNHGNFHTILDHPNFDRNRQTVIFHYSSGQTLATPQVHDMINSYAVNRQFNFIVIFYHDVNTISTGNTNDLARAIANNQIQLFDRGYNSGNMNFVGFGLGAQIMARASRQVQSLSSRRHVIARLTGLDPFNLGPISSITIGRLSSADAQFVESIHCEGSLRGDHDSRGHISFFVNGGVSQPGCSQTFPTTRAECNHVFCMTVWAESVRSTGPTFPALACDSQTEFNAGRCNSNAVANMGRGSLSSNLRGTHFLNTNLVAPFSRNQAQP